MSRDFEVLLESLVNDNGLILQCCKCHNCIKTDRSIIDLSEDEKEMLKKRMKENYTVNVSHGFCSVCTEIVMEDLRSIQNV